MDNVLFVLGLFLLTRRVRPLLAQVRAFTVAHSIMLALSKEEDGEHRLHARSCCELSDRINRQGRSIALWRTPRQQKSAR